MSTTLDAPQLDKPQIVPYRFHRLKEVPLRLWRAPALPDWMTNPSLDRSTPGSPDAFSVEGTEKRSNKPAKFRKVRSFAKSSMAEVRLSDVLSGKHMPPLTLREFEDYLAHVERSPENLYFIFWLRNYHQEYRAWETSVANQRTASNTPGVMSERTELCISLEGRGFKAHGDESIKTFSSQAAPTAPDTSFDVKTHLPPKHLQQSFQLAMTTFFGTDPTSPSVLELNLSSGVLKKTRIDAEHSIDPTIFKAAKGEVLGMLEQSMRSWITYAAGNADNQRVTFAVVVGLGSILGALAATICAYYYSTNRGLRLVPTPILFLGVSTFTCSLYRMCPILWLFAPARQCHSWELIRAAGTEDDRSVTGTTIIAAPDVVNVPLTRVRIDRQNSRDAEMMDQKDEKQAMADELEERRNVPINPEIDAPTPTDASKGAIPDWDSAFQPGSQGEDGVRRGAGGLSQDTASMDGSTLFANSTMSHDLSPWSEQFKGRGVLPQGLAPRSVPTSSIPMGLSMSATGGDDRQSTTSTTHSNNSVFAYFNLSRFTSTFPANNRTGAGGAGPRAPSPLVSLPTRASSPFSTPMFAPVTRVMNPLINRFHRTVILQSAAWAFLAVVVWIVIWTSIPPRR